MAVIKVYGDVQEQDPIHLSYTHIQVAPASVWSITHGLGYNPAGIIVRDSAGSKWIPSDVEYLTNDTLNLYFGTKLISGTANLS